MTEVPDRLNWRTPPVQHTAFHQIEQIFPTAKIDNGPSTPLAEAPVDLTAFTLDGMEGPLDLAATLEATETDALVILHKGEIVFETYAHDTTAMTPHILMSSTKAMMGLLAGLLAEAGKVDLDSQVTDLVPEALATAYAGATLRDLLDMRAGAMLNAEQTAAYEVVLGEGGDIRALITGLTESQQAHGGPFRYISANTDLLGWALERATGQTVAALFSQYLWKPMGAEQPAHLITDDKGAAWCAGGLAMTARDFARVGQLLVDANQTILPPALIDDLISNGDREAWAAGDWMPGFGAIGQNMSYRNGWIVNETPGRLFAMGVHGQNLFIDRESQLVIAKLSSQSQRLNFGQIMLHHRMAAELRRMLTS